MTRTEALLVTALVTALALALVALALLPARLRQAWIAEEQRRQARAIEAREEMARAAAAEVARITAALRTVLGEQQAVLAGNRALLAWATTQLAAACGPHGAAPAPPSTTRLERAAASQEPRTPSVDPSGFALPPLPGGAAPDAAAGLSRPRARPPERRTEDEPTLVSEAVATASEALPTARTLPSMVAQRGDLRRPILDRSDLDANLGAD
jgi:hypothetical protein